MARLVLLVTICICLFLLLFAVFSGAQAIGESTYQVEWLTPTPTPVGRAFLPLVTRNWRACGSPILISPENGSQLDTIAPLYEWDSTSDPAAVRGYLEVATDSGFEKVVQRLSYRPGYGYWTFRFTENLSPATTYHWRAYIVCSPEITGTASAVFTFTTGSGGVMLPAPALQSPANDSSLPAGNITLAWSPVAGAIEYLVRWRPLGLDGYLYEWVPGNVTQLSVEVFPGPYEWWVAARNNYAIGTESPKWRFTVYGSTSAVHLSTQELLMKNGHTFYVYRSP